MQIKTYKLRWLLPVTVLWLLTGCQSRSVIQTNKRLSSGSNQALIEYAKTCNSVLETMADRGGAIAKSADEHAIDAERLDQAWPQQVKPDKQS